MKPFKLIAFSVTVLLFSLSSNIALSGPQLKQYKIYNINIGYRDLDFSWFVVGMACGSNQPDCVIDPNYMRAKVRVCARLVDSHQGACFHKTIDGDGGTEGGRETGVILKRLLPGREYHITGYFMNGHGEYVKVLDTHKTTKPVETFAYARIIEKNITTGKTVVEYSFSNPNARSLSEVWRGFFYEDDKYLNSQEITLEVNRSNGAFEGTEIFYPENAPCKLTSMRLEDPFVIYYYVGGGNHTTSHRWDSLSWRYEGAPNCPD